MIRPPQKMYWDEERQERSSVPRFKRHHYVPFKPHSTGQIFKPLNVHLPDYIVKRRLIRLLNYLQETGQYEKLNALITQLRGEKIV